MIDKEIQIFEQLLDDGRGTLSILCGGFNQNNPKAFMDGIVSKYVGDRMYNEFIEVFLDNPYLRVIITGINEIDFDEYMDEKHTLKSIKERLKSSKDGNAK